RRGRTEATAGVDVADAAHREVRRDDSRQRGAQCDHLLLRGLHALPQRSEQAERSSQIAAADRTHDAVSGTALTQGCVFTGPAGKRKLSAFRVADARRGAAGTRARQVETGRRTWRWTKRN